MKAYPISRVGEFPWGLTCPSLSLGSLLLFKNNFPSVDTCALCVLNRLFRWWLGWSTRCFLVTSHDPLTVAVSACRSQLQTSKITSLLSWSSCIVSCKPRRAGSPCSLPPTCSCPLPCRLSNHEHHLPSLFYNIVHMDIFYYSDLTSF